jgi:hypothetical protein
VSASELVPQDTDSAFDMYDARACMAVVCFPAVPVSSPACVSADACRPGPTPQPSIFGAPASATFAGPGNPSPTVAVQLAGKRGKAKAKRKSKRAKHSARHRRRRHARRSQGTTGTRNGEGR